MKHSINRHYLTINASLVEALTKEALEVGLTLQEAARAAFGEGVTVSRLHRPSGELWGAEVDIKGASYTRFTHSMRATKTPLRERVRLFADSVARIVETARKAA